MITLVTFGLMLCRVFPETNRLRKFEGLKAESAVLTEDTGITFQSRPISARLDSTDPAVIRRPP
jgi:hypothetical protein